MFYAEILIGPPGSGKSTYAKYKKDSLRERDVMIINLDPGNMNSGFDYDTNDEALHESSKNVEGSDLNTNSQHISNKDTATGQKCVKHIFDYDIKSISCTKDFMQKNDLGPHFSAKCILKKFLNDFDNFKDLFINKENVYLIIDFPGQVEFLISDDTLKKFTKKLMNLGFYLVAVNLVDIVFFLDKQILLSTYLMSTIAMVLLELPQICVASKCDNLKKFVCNNLEDVLTGRNLEMVNHKKYDRDDTKTDANAAKDTYAESLKFYQSIIELIDNEGLVNFEILDYENPEAMMYLQLIIDQSSGYFYNEDPHYEPVSKEELIKRYLK